MKKSKTKIRDFLKGCKSLFRFSWTDFRTTLFVRCDSRRANPEWNTALNGDTFPPKYQLGRAVLLKCLAQIKNILSSIQLGMKGESCYSSQNNWAWCTLYSVQWTSHTVVQRTPHTVVQRSDSRVPAYREHSSSVGPSLFPPSPHCYTRSSEVTVQKIAVKRPSSNKPVRFRMAFLNNFSNGPRMME